LLSRYYANDQTLTNNELYEIQQLLELQQQALQQKLYPTQFYTQPSTTSVKRIFKFE
jgi:hypothetical protein